MNVIDFANATKEELAAWYLETIGYDPFEDCPSVTIEDVRQICIDYVAAVAIADAEEES